MLTSSRTSSLSRVVVLFCLGHWTACEVQPTATNDNRLDETLRVLDVRSEPAQIAPGQLAELSALVHFPPTCDEEPQYDWSWCPIRGDGGSDFSCELGESQVRQIWDDTNPGVPFVGYDLGSSSTAEFENVFGDFAVDLCEALTNSRKSDPIVLACIDGLDLSVRLQISQCGRRVVALKSLSLWNTDEEEAQRNENPDPSGRLLFQELQENEGNGPPEGGEPLPFGTPLEAGRSYLVRLELDNLAACAEEDPDDGCQAQRFQPPGDAVEESPEARRETLVMSWFLEAASTPSNSSESNEQNLGPRTVFVDGETLFDPLLENILHLREGQGPGQMTIHVVLRDERGGSGWSTHTFDVAAGE